MSQPGTLASTEDASNVNDPKVIITLAPPLREADTSNGGSQLNQNEAIEGEGSSSSGSTVGSHSDMSVFHSLHSNDIARRRFLTGRCSSIDSTHSDMSGCRSLHSNDEAEGKFLTGRCSSSDSIHSDMSGCRSLHSNDEADGKIASGQSLGERSNEGPNSDVRGFHSLHSNDQPQKRTQSCKVEPQRSSDRSRIALRELLHSLYSNDQTRKRSAMRRLLQERTAQGQSLSHIGNEGPKAALSVYGSLHSNDQLQKRQRTPRPMAALRSEKGTSSDSDDISKPATLASTESAPHDDALESFRIRMLALHNLHSNDQPQKRIAKEQSVGQRSNEGPDAAMSGYRCLHSNDQPQNRTAQGQSLSHIGNEGANAAVSVYGSLHSNDLPQKRQRTPRPMAALRSKKGASSDSDDISHPATLASTESAPHYGALQSSQFLHVGRPLSEVEGSSMFSSWRSPRSIESPLKWPQQDEDDVSPSLPVLLHSISEKESEDITKHQKKRLRSV